MDLHQTLIYKSW